MDWIRFLLSSTVFDGVLGSVSNLVAVEFSLIDSNSFLFHKLGSFTNNLSALSTSAFKDV